MKINNILVSLDLSDFDRSVIDYALFFAGKATEKPNLILFHNIRYDFLDDSLGLEPDEIRKLKDTIEHNIRVAYKQKITQAGLSHEILVQDDNSTAQSLLRTKNEKYVDLIIMGQKKPPHGAGILPQKVLTLDQDRTPVLLVPVGLSPKIDKILAPIDLSPATTKILNWVTLLSEQLQTKSQGIYVYQLPMTYFPYFTASDDELEAQLKRKAEKRIESFLKKNAVKPKDNWPIAIKKGANITKVILEYLEKNPADLVVLGRIGRTNLLGNQLGGVARRFIAARSTRPLLIV